MNCKDTEEIIHGYLDGELDLVRSLAVEEHLKDCTTCSRTYQSRQSLRKAIAGGAFYFNAPEGLESRVRSAVRQANRAQLQAEHRPRNWTWAWPKLALPIAAAALVLIFAIPLLTGQSSESRVLDEVVSAHIRSLMADTVHLTDVASTDQHTVKPWFTGKLPFSPPVHDLAAQGFALIGGRLDYFEHHPVAALVYQRRKHFINLFIWPSGSQSTSGPVFRRRQGYNVVHWTAGDMVYWAVSDVNADDLREFVKFTQPDSVPR